MKKILLILGISVLSLIIIALIITYFALPMYLSSEGGKTLLESKISEALNGNTKIAETNMSWSGGLKIKGLKIENAQIGDMTVWQEVDEVELVPSYLTLLSDTIVVSSITLKAPRIEVEFTDTVKKDQRKDVKDSNSRITAPKQKDDSKGFAIKHISLINGSVHFRDHSYPDIANINLDGSISMKSEEMELNIADLNMNVQNGSVRGKCYYTAGKETVKSDIDVDIKNVETVSSFGNGLRYLLPFFQTELGDISSNVNLKMKSTGSGNSFRDMLSKSIGNGELLITNGKFSGNPVLSTLSTFLSQPSLASLKFDTINERFTIKDGKIYNTMTEAIGKSGNLTMNGWVDFDLNMDYRIILDEKVVAKASKNIARLINTANKAGGVRLKGKVTSPKIDVDVEKAIKSGIKDILEKELQDKLYKKPKKKK